jgi:hypothetical protein
MFKTDGWSTTIFQVREPERELFEYVKTGSGLPIKSVCLKLALVLSLKVNP